MDRDVGGCVLPEAVAARLRILDDCGFVLIHDPCRVACCTTDGFERLERAALAGARLAQLPDELLAGDEWRWLMAHVRYFGSLNMPETVAHTCPHYANALALGRVVLAAADANTATLTGQIVRAWRRP